MHTLRSIPLHLFFFPKSPTLKTLQLLFHHYPYPSYSSLPLPPPKLPDVASLTEAVRRQKDDAEWDDHELVHILSSSSSGLFLQAHLLQVIKDLKDSNKALRFFEWWSSIAKNQFGGVSIHGPTAFQVLFELASREQPKPHLRLKQLLCKSRELGFSLSATSASLVIRSLGRAGMLDECLQVFLNDTPSYTRKASLYNDVIETLLLAGSCSSSVYCDRAFELVREMLRHRDAKSRPNHVTWSILFSTLFNTRGEEREGIVIDLLIEMAKHCGLFPKPLQLSKLVSKLCRSGRSSKAWEVLHAVMEAGGPIEASAFNALLIGLGREADFRRMNLLLGEMKDMSIKPSVFTFGILINFLCKSRRVDEALQLFDNIAAGEDANNNLDSVIFNTLIDGLCKAGRPEEGLDLLDRMRSLDGCSPNTVTYNCLIDGFCKAGEIDKSSELFGRMVEEGVPPNVITLSTIIDGMCRHGMISSALEFFDEMRSTTGLEGDIVTYTTLIGAFLHANNVEKAIRLFKEMVSKGLSPDSITYFTLISGLSQAGKIEEAHSIAYDMQEEGFPLDTVAYNMLISGFCKRKKLDKAYEVLQEMDKAGVKPDQVTFNTLISALSKAGDFSAAHQVMNKMIEPTVVTYGALIHGYCEADKIDEALEVFRAMRITPSKRLDELFRVNTNPSREMKESLSKATGITIKLVSRWFESARRRLHILAKMEANTTKGRPPNNENNTKETNDDYVDPKGEKIGGKSNGNRNVGIQLSKGSVIVLPKNGQRSIHESGEGNEGNSRGYMLRKRKGTSNDVSHYRMSKGLSFLQEPRRLSLVDVGP